MDNKKKKQIISTGLIVLVILIGLFASVKALIGNNSEETDAPIYSTSEVVKGDIQVGVKAKGQLQATRGGGIEVPGGFSFDRPAVNFVVNEILIEEGDAVKQGQLLIKLASPDLGSSLDAKKDELDSLLTELSDMTGKPESEVESINPANGIVLTAPITGRISSLDVSEGNSLSVGHIIANVVNDSQFKVKAKLTSGEVNKVKTGDPVMLKFPYFDGLIEGKITSIGNAPTPSTESDSEYASGYVYIVKITAENPGLVQEDMDLFVGIAANDNQTVDFFKNQAVVDGFMEEEKLLNKVDDTIVTDIHVDPFQSVKKGDPIVTLSGDDMQESIRSKLDQVRELKRTISQLEEQFDYLEVRSTINGIVSYIDTKVGDSVMPGRWLGDIYNTDKMMLYIQVDDIDIVNVVQGAPVTVTIDAMSGETFEGSVMNVSSHGNTSGGVTKYGVNIEVTGGEGLRPGMQATGYIDAGSAEDVLLIPVEAIFDENGEQMVEVLEDGNPELKKVTLGLMNDRYAEVLDGLEEGDLVITGSSNDLLPSEHIKADDSLIPSGNDSGDDSDEE